MWRSNDLELPPWLAMCQGTCCQFGEQGQTLEDVFDFQEALALLLKTLCFGTQRQDSARLARCIREMQNRNNPASLSATRGPRPVNNFVNGGRE